MIEILGRYIILFIDKSGLFGIFILMTLESALIPIPSEVTMPFSGFLVSRGQFLFWIVVLVGAFGNLFGSLLAYYLGSYGEETVRHIIRKYGKLVLLSEKEYNHAESWFRKYGEMIVFASRLLPVIRTFISLPAGIARMNIKKFVIYTFIGSLIWSALLTYIGVVMGDNWKTLGAFFHKFDLIISIVGIAIVAFYFYHKIKHLRHHKTP